MFFDSWNDLLRVVVVGVCAYVSLIVLLRAFGKRTLSKMNAFDLVVTVALGSTLATILLDRNVTLSEGVLALGLLMLLQFVITWSSVRWKPVRDLVASEPRLLLHEGEFLEDAMRRERINRDEILQGLRNAGVDDPSQARCVVLETDGSFSVIRR